MADPPGRPACHPRSHRRAALEQELQSYPQLSEEQRAAALADHEKREREYSRLQRQRLCMDDFEPLKLIGKVRCGVGVGVWARVGGSGGVHASTLRTAAGHRGLLLEGESGGATPCRAAPCRHRPRLPPAALHTRAGGVWRGAHLP